jgi:hypothetical protein
MNDRERMSTTTPTMTENAFYRAVTEATLAFAARRFGSDTHAHLPERSPAAAPICAWDDDDEWAAA